ncbi:hypothetical protein [Clostridium sp. LIBA-8841]|uniref:hypothetical protein n=1 Tax=Clostridium sp. LIBA-8841 TaxID=2987530 RepID=UPI002AC40CFB|nr:hypothetical protein [Clostridium sp. LIBA-8841]MDZ5252108.1 hypothetical protein [Clostridium sp. LIBA-8841]
MLVKEYELKSSDNIIENKIPSDLEKKFLKLYSSIKKYEKENKLDMMCLKLKSYLELLKESLDNLEKITKNDCENKNEVDSFLKSVRKELNIINIKIEDLNDKSIELSEEEIIEEFLLNLKYEVLPNINEYKEALNGAYSYHNELRISFGVKGKEIEKEFLIELKKFLNNSTERLKEKINLDSKSILNEIKLISHEDVNLNVIDIIKNEVLELNILNEEIFSIYLKGEKKIFQNFLDIQNNLGISMEEHKLYESQKVDYSSLNKRFFKLIDFYNKGFLKSRILIDLEKFIGSESIKNKIEIELLYALDFIKEEYVKNLENLVLKYKEKIDEIIYINFENKYGNIFSVSEQIDILNYIYLHLNNMQVNDLSKITLVDYLNNSKRNKRYI